MFTEVVKSENAVLLVNRVDDNNPKHKQMSELLELYGFRGTFFPISSSWDALKDSLVEMYKKGHEIGSHTFSHKNFTDLKNDSVTVDFELTKSKEMHESLFGKKCLIFAEPFHGRSDLSLRLAFKRYMFVRNNSEYPGLPEVLLPYVNLTIPKLTSVLDNAINTASLIRLYGHSIDGEGSGPITKDFFIESLKVIKDYAANKDLWVTSLQDASLYQNIYNEITLEKSLNNDTLTLQITGFNEDKYIDFLEVPLSIQIPKSICDGIEVIGDSIPVVDRPYNRVITFDLLNNQEIRLILKNISKIDSSYVESKGILIYPNPLNDQLNFIVDSADQVFSTKIFDINGKLLIEKNDGNSNIDVHALSSGSYIVEVKSVNNSTKKIYRKIFNKV